MSTAGDGKGYIKLYRTLLDHPKANSPDHMAIWVTLLMMATHRPRKIDWCGKTIELQPGQLITSYPALAKQTGVSETRSRRVMERLIIDGQIDKRSSNLSSLITIINWCEYQMDDRPIDRQMTDERQTNDRPVTANKNGEECKNVRMDTISCPIPAESDDLVLKPVELKYSEPFLRFWKVYPIKKDKGDAWKVWKRLRLDSLIETILQAIELQRPSRAWRDGFIKHPATWLNKRCWEDEVTVERSKPSDPPLSVGQPEYAHKNGLITIGGKA